ncbi:hypothetical protein TNCV_1876491 [Trichonephila clavipes]|nr:hypothetical protein TNCV_1876491 [Trichonephila clavipes]
MPYVLVAERSGRRRCPVTTITVGHRLEAVLNDLPVSINQAQFEPMPNRARSVLAPELIAMCINLEPTYHQITYKLESCFLPSVTHTCVAVLTTSNV